MLLHLLGLLHLHLHLLQLLGGELALLHHLLHKLLLHQHLLLQELLLVHSLCLPLGHHLLLLQLSTCGGWDRCWCDGRSRARSRRHHRRLAGQRRPTAVATAATGRHRAGQLAVHEQLGLRR